MSRIIDITGKKFGSWTVIRISERQYADGSYYWWCRCECGKEKEVRGTNLRTGRATVCGFGCRVLVKKKRKEILEKKICKNEGGCWLWEGYKKKSGYGSIGRDMPVHRYAYEVYKGEIPENMCVCHTCDVKHCCNPKHLWLGTSQENNNDKIEKERIPVGEKAGRAKLTEIQVKEIFHLHKNLKLSFRKIAQIYGVSSPNIANIIHRRSWKHLQLD